MFTVLFVCTGNTCRSPMAERLLKHLAQKEGLAEQIKAVSAGVFACDGDEMSANSAQVLAKHNISAADFCATRLRQWHIDEANLILGMSPSHTGAVVDFFPEAQAKTFTLGSFSGQDVEVKDPFGQSVEHYEKCFRQLEELITLALPKIISQAKEEHEQ